MRKYAKLSIAVFLFAAIASCKESSTNSQYDEYFINKDFNGSVLIVKEGKTVYQKNFGYANIEDKKETNPNDTYLIGSITKQFTGLSILMLQERKLLSTKDSIGKYYFNLPKAWAQSTISEVLSHSSGLPSFDDLPDDFTIEYPFSSEKLIDSIKNESLPFFEKGKFRYSEIGYVLLGNIISKVSGMSYSDFLSKNIFIPLKMDHTGCVTDSINLTTIGYAKSDDNSLYAVPFNFHTYADGNANLYSCAIDLVKWNASIQERKFVSDSTFNKWFAPYVEVTEQSEYEDKGDFLGYGWFMTMKEDSVLKAYHLGGVTGYKASITRFPKEQLLVLTLSNMEDEYSNKIRLEFPKLVHDNELKKNHNIN